MSKVADHLPNLPETEVIEPILQCGVLYLGTALPTPGQRGLNSIQEPLSHRYPIDGTNTVRGIDAILSIYDNGIQLVFARQTHVALFYPLASLIYCASVRYAIVEHEQNSLLDWRFVTIDATDPSKTKYPPLFAAVMQRTQIQSGDECHCFITKNDDAALALVRTISEIYANLSAETKLLKSPIFYQLDRYGRRISETTGTIYLSPAKETDRLFTSLDRNDLLDPSYEGFFYRTDTTVIEKWQLWDDNEQTDADRIRSRPRPPPSPFGLHQGLYHDDLSSDIHHHLRQMEDDDEDQEDGDELFDDRSSTTSSTLSDDSQIYRHETKNRSFSRSFTSSFDPSIVAPMRAPPTNVPIVIEKVLPKPSLPLPPPPLLPPPPPPALPPSEPISSNGNRIIYEDVVRPKVRRRRSKRIPIIDLQSLSSQSSINAEILEGFFEDRQGKTTDLTGSDAESMLRKLHVSSKRHRNHRERQRQPSHSSTVISKGSLSYGQRSIPSITHPDSIQNYINNTYGTVHSSNSFYSQ